MMTDDLRDRIAAVAQNHVRCDDCTFAKTPEQQYLHFADTLIRELGLRQDTYQLLTRYVTEWHTHA